MKKLHLSYSELDDEKAASLARCLFNLDELHFTDVRSSQLTALSLEAILNAFKSKPYLVNEFVAYIFVLIKVFFSRLIG